MTIVVDRTTNPPTIRDLTDEELEAFLDARFDDETNTQPYQCSVCESPYETIADAASCCARWKAEKQ